MIGSKYISSIPFVYLPVLVFVPSFMVAIGYFVLPTLACIPKFLLKTHLCCKAQFRTAAPPPFVTDVWAADRQLLGKKFPFPPHL